MMLALPGTRLDARAYFSSAERSGLWWKSLKLSRTCCPTLDSNLLARFVFRYCLSRSEHQMLEVTSIKEVTDSFH